MTRNLPTTIRKYRFLWAVRRLQSWILKVITKLEVLCYGKRLKKPRKPVQSLQHKVCLRNCKRLVKMQSSRALRRTPEWQVFYRVCYLPPPSFPNTNCSCSPASSSEASDQVEMHRQMSSIAFQYRRTIVAKRKRKTEAFAMVSPEIKKWHFQLQLKQSVWVGQTRILPSAIDKEFEES